MSTVIVMDRAGNGENMDLDVAGRLLALRDDAVKAAAEINRKTRTLPWAAGLSISILIAPGFVSVADAMIPAAPAMLPVVLGVSLAISIGSMIHGVMQDTLSCYPLRSANGYQTTAFRLLAEREGWNRRLGRIPSQALARECEHWKRLASLDANASEFDPEPFVSMTRLVAPEWLRVPDLTEDGKYRLSPIGLDSVGKLLDVVDMAARLPGEWPSEEVRSKANKAIADMMGSAVVRSLKTSAVDEMALDAINGQGKDAQIDRALVDERLRLEEAASAAAPVARLAMAQSTQDSLDA